MKRNGKSWVFFALQLTFMLVAPCGFIWLQYGDLTLKYKISVTAIILVLLVFLTFKKIFINNWLRKLDAKIVGIETNALSVTDPAAIQTMKKSWRACSVAQTLFSAIIPLLVFVLAILTIKAVEDGLIKLFGCLVFCLISIGIGLVFRIAEIYSMKSAHEKRENKE